MFRNAQIFSSFSSDDIAKTKDFYANTLELEVSQADDLLQLHVAGGNPIIVYPKPNHTPAAFTVLNLPVDNMEQTVDALIGRGVRFEQYEGEYQTDVKGIFRDTGVKLAWFKDPAGNILSLMESN